MKAFALRLRAPAGAQEIGGVTSFIGEDASGSFGLLAGHARMITALVIGLARFRVGADRWTYLAVPGAILYFHDDVLALNTRRYLLDDDYTRISAALQQQLLAEEEALHSIKKSLHRMEDEVLKRLWGMGRREAV